MRRSRSPSSSSPFRALAHHQPPTATGDSVSLIRSFNVETNPARPIRPSPLTASTIRDMPLDLVDRLRSFPLFQSAPEDFLVEIGNHLKPQVQAANDHVITEGDDAKAMYWLIRGVVAVTSRDGEAVYAELKSGAFFGEIGVLMDMPRTATIVARTKCLLLILKKEDLHTIMPKFPQMEQAIREEAQERLTLLKKKRQEGNSLLKSPKAKGELTSRTAAPGEVSRGDSGVLKDGSVINSKKRKSPSPGIIEDPAVGSAIGSGFVNIRHTLRELPLFSNLPAEILHFLGLSAQPKMYPPFKDIVKEGTSGSEIFFIVQGEAEVVYRKDATSKDGRIPKRPRLRAGQYFGEVSSLGLSRERTATVRSITTVECLIIPGDTLDELWRRCPADVKAQVEETARTRMEQKDEDVEMTDVDAKSRSSHSGSTTPATPTKSQPPHLTLTNASKPASPSKDDSDRMEPKDPDPFLSVNMENLRNRRRQSLAPPIPTLDHTKGMNGGLPSPDGTTLKFAFSQTSLDSDVPAKRARRSSRPASGSTGPVLSDAILVRIFDYFDVVELLRMRRVNSHWRRIITTHQDVCHNVDLSHYNRHVTDQVLTQVLAPFIGTRARLIDLNNCFHITDDGFSSLWKSCGKNVRCWKMRSVWDVSASQILDMSENAKELREVDWSNCRKVGDNLLGRVVGWVVPENSPTMQKKAVAHSHKKSRSRHHAAETTNETPPVPGTVIGCPKLDTLNLSYCKHITDRSMAHLAAHASDRIRSLWLTRCTSITDAGFQSWAQYKFEKLTHLCLADCTYLSDHAVVALANAAKSLTHLDLSFCCALSDTATEVVALGLPKLRELRLAFCGSAVSDASLQTIALHLPELEGLSVRGCVRVTGKGVESLIKECTWLSWLDVSQCRNLEGWLRGGGPMKWGYGNRLKSEWSSDEEDEAPSFSPPTFGPKVMSVNKLTSNSSFARRAGLGGIARRTRQPVRFIVEKGPDGLR